MKTKTVIAVSVAVLGLLAAGVFWAAFRHDSAPPSAAALYQCPMHHEVTAPAPGTCPICKMDLVRVDRASGPEETGVLYQCPMHHEVTAPAPGTCPICKMDLVRVDGNRGEVFVPEEKEQWIGVRTAVVRRENLTRRVRASARVSTDPELYTALAERREILENMKRAGGDPEAERRAETLLRSSRLRLAQAGLNEGQIEKLSQGDGAGLLAGGGTPWVYAQIFEDQGALVKPGQTVTLTSPALPGRTWTGTVSSVDRAVDPATRTLRARIAPGGSLTGLLPEMFLEADIRVELGRALSVPREAVIDTGVRRLAYVKTRPGHYAPRDITLGREAGERVEVLSGLGEGEEVVSSGAFLVDSESRIKAVAAHD